MCDTGYSVKRLVEDLKELRTRGEPEAAMLEEARDLVKRLLLMKHNWLRGSMQVPSGDPSTAGVFQLHEEPDHSLAVSVVTWAPGGKTGPHNHATWAVIGGLDGWETQHRWKRVEGANPASAQVRRVASERIDARTIVALDSQAIHSVENDSGAPSVTLNVYGVNPDYTDRRRFDPGG